MIQFQLAAASAPRTNQQQQQREEHFGHDFNRQVDLPGATAAVLTVPLTDAPFQGLGRSGYIIQAHEQVLHLQGQYKVGKAGRPSTVSNGMSHRRIQPKGNTPYSMSSQSNQPQPVHICLCQPTPKIPRPRNAFILFRQHHHSAVMAQNPGKSNPAISKIIGEMWKNAAEDTRKEWQNHADEEKRQHMARYPEYRYQPRRPAKKGSSSSSASPSDTSGEPSQCPRCGGRTGAFTLAEASSFPILPVPHISRQGAPGLPQSSSLRSLLGPSTGPFGRLPSPGDHKRKRSDEAAEYHPGAEALIQLGSHERDYPSRSMAPITSTTTNPVEAATTAETKESPERPTKRIRSKSTNLVTTTKNASELHVNTSTSRTATSPAMSYQSATSDHLLERRVSDPPSYRPMHSQQHQRRETFSPDLLDPNYNPSSGTHHSPRGSGRNPVERTTSSTTPTGPPTDKIQQIQRITRPVSNRSLLTASPLTGPSSSISPSSESLSPLSSTNRPILIAIEVSDQRLVSALSQGLHSELSTKFRNVRTFPPMDVPEWRQFLTRNSDPEDLSSVYLRAVAASRQFVKSTIAIPLYEQGISQTVGSPFGHDQRTLPHLGSTRSPVAGGSSLSINILQQYIFTHSAMARKRLSPTGNESPIYTWEWCIDVWKGSPRPDLTIVVRNDEGTGVVNIEAAELGLMSVPAPTGGINGSTWEPSILRRLAFEVQEFIVNR